jgi:hypothetical protein
MTGRTSLNMLFKTIKNTLLQNRNTIEVTDFGAGSKVFKSNKEK